jgi:hypothetical protein
MAQVSSSTNVLGGNQGAPTLNANIGSANLYMMRADVDLHNMTYDYRMPEYVEKGKEAPNLLSPFHIEKTMGETVTRIPKG